MTNKRTEQLGMNPSTAYGRLRKELLYLYVKKAGDHYCYRCNEEIKTIDEFSVEHKDAWLDSENPVELFFSIENIGVESSTSPRCLNLMTSIFFTPDRSG